MVSDKLAESSRVFRNSLKSITKLPAELMRLVFF
jgi:hypothetical protein